MDDGWGKRGEKWNGKRCRPPGEKPSNEVSVTDESQVCGRCSRVKAQSMPCALRLSACLRLSRNILLISYISQPGAFFLGLPVRCSRVRWRRREQFISFVSVPRVQSRAVLLSADKLACAASLTALGLTRATGALMAGEAAAFGPSPPSAQPPRPPHTHTHTHTQKAPVRLGRSSTMNVGSVRSKLPPRRSLRLSGTADPISLACTGRCKS